MFFSVIHSKWFKFQMVQIRLDRSSKTKKSTYNMSESPGKILTTFLYARRRRDVLWDHPWRAVGVLHSLCGAYLQNYTSYGYETSWEDRSHKGRVQCTGIITLACLIFELLPFVVFHT